MWLVSMLVLVPVFYLATGQPITPEIAIWLSKIVPDDASISEQSVALGCITGIALAGSPLHLIGRYLPTVVHELGHAFTAGVLGGRPQQITISLDTSGLAYFRPPQNWGKARATLVFIAGYLAPPIAALAAVMAAQAGFPQSWCLFSTGVLAIAIVFLVRNIWGFIWTAAVVAGCYYGVIYLPAGLIAISVPVIAGYLSIEGFRDARMQQRIIKLSPGSGCDAECIAQYWRLNPVIVARVHTLLVVVIGGIALRLAIEPYWSEIYQWGEEIVSSRTLDRLLP